VGEPPPGSPREEAERLIVAALAMVSVAAKHWLASSGDAGHGYATGSAECCACPICRGLAAVRDPSPEFAERLATGAGDLADGVTTLLRAFGDVLGRPAARRPGDPRPGGSRREDPWRTATAERPAHPTDPDTASQTPRPPVKTANKAVRKVVPKGDLPGDLPAPLATDNGDAAS
jgi:hypothetical protein